MLTLLFDGVVAGDPGFRLSRAAIGEAWDTSDYNDIAPKDAQGHPLLANALSAGDLTLLSKAVLEQCDALDGLKDGEINNAAACKFDPAVLECKGGKTGKCLSAAQVGALKRSFDGARDSKGNQLYAGWPYDAGLGDMGWRMWKLGNSETGWSNAVNVLMGLHALQDYFVSPAVNGFEPLHTDFDRIAGQVEETRQINDADSTDMTAFSSHGGRMLIYQGMSDPVFSASDIVDYPLFGS